MARTFAITTTAAEKKADAKGHAEAVFTVTNTTARPVRGLAKAKALVSTKQDWLKLAGDSERDFAPGATQQFIIGFDGPVTTAVKYSLRLDVASAANPDEDFIEGPVVTIEMPPAAIKKPFKWWIIPIRWLGRAK